MAFTAGIPEPDEAMSKAIALQASSLAAVDINAKIEEKKEEARHAPGFKGAAFKIAEWLDGSELGDLIKSVIGFFTDLMGLKNPLENGFVSAAAKMSRQPIPTSDEVRSVSNVIGNSVAEALTKDDAFDKSFKTSDEFKAEMEKRLYAQLSANNAAYPDFSDDNLKEAAQKAAEKLATSEQFSGLFDKDGNRIGQPGKGSFLESAAAGKIAEVLDKELGAKEADLAKALGNKDGKLTAQDKDAFVAALTPVVSQLQAVPKDSLTPEMVSDKIDEALGKSEYSAFNALAPEVRKVMANEMAIQAGDALGGYKDKKGFENFKKNASNEKFAAANLTVGKMFDDGFTAQDKTSKSPKDMLETALGRELKPGQVSAIKEAVTSVIAPMALDGKDHPAVAVATELQNKLAGVIDPKNPLSAQISKVMAETVVMQAANGGQLKITGAGDTFAQGAAKNKLALIQDITKAQISQQVQEGLREKTVLTCAQTFHDDVVKARFTPGTRDDLNLIYASYDLKKSNGDSGKDVPVIKDGLKNPENDNQKHEADKFKDAQSRIYEAAVKDHKALNPEQMKIVGDRVAKLTVEALAKPENKNQTISQIMSDVMKNKNTVFDKTTLDALEGASGLDKANSVENVNKAIAGGAIGRLLGYKVNVIDKITEGLQESFEDNQLNKPMLGKLEQAQKAISAANMAKTGEKTASIMPMSDVALKTILNGFTPSAAGPAIASGGPRLT